MFVQNRANWINGKTTYQAIFYENFPQVHVYFFGDIDLIKTQGQAQVVCNQIGDGISVNGVIRQVAFSLQPSTGATATAQVIVDGANEATTVDFSAMNSATQFPVTTNVMATYVHNTTQESYNIHDIRLVANQSGNLTFNGVTVYFQGPNAIIDQFPGTSYVNKTKSSTITGVSLAIPSFGSSLGGNALIYKTQTAGYTISALSATTIASTASGSSGTNLMNMSVGTGASLLAGYGMVVTQGSSTYISPIVSISTDTLTMGNTLGFGLTAGSPIYTAWQGGVSLPINASLMTLAYTIDFAKLASTIGFSSTVYEPTGKYAFWWNNVGMSLIDSQMCGVFLGASGFMQVDGYFSAAEIETISPGGIFSATMSVNGFPSWSQNVGQTGVISKTVFTNAGPGWNSFNIGCGASMTAGISISNGIGIQKINLYQMSRNYGISYGQLSDIDLCQTYTNRDSINASLMALGGIQRVYADQIYFKNTWTRGATWTVPGGAYYQGASTNGSFSFQYYGTNFGVCATFYVGGTLTLDGIGFGLTANVMQSVATLGFHTISYTGGTAVISAIDYLNPVGKISVDANISPVGFAPAASLAPASFFRCSYGNISNWTQSTPTTMPLSFGAGTSLLLQQYNLSSITATNYASGCGLNFTFPALGPYMIIAQGNVTNAGTHYCHLRMVDTNGNKISEHCGMEVSSGNQFTMVGVYNATNTNTTIQILAYSDGTNNIQIESRGGGIIDVLQWDVFQIK